jgi:transposase InsO family protein
MTTQQKLIQRKLSLLDLASYLGNVSEACHQLGFSRDSFYRLKERYEQQGLEGLKEFNRRQPNLRNRCPAEVEEAIVQVALDYPAFGQVRAAAKLLELKGHQLSPAGVRCVWQRHNLETKTKRLKALEARVAKEGCVLTETQLQALEAARQEKEAHGEIETEHPGYLGAQDTFYVGTMKGVGRIYQQTFIDTYSRVAFAKLYTMKTALTAADLLNDRVLPFFEDEGIALLRVLTDRGTEYCGSQERHEFQLYLALSDIDHTKTKAKSPQTNGICERFHKTVLEEFYQIALRKKIYTTIEALQADLDEWMEEYNVRRPHQGKRCDGRTPYATLTEAKPLALRAQLSA